MLASCSEVLQTLVRRAVVEVKDIPLGAEVIDLLARVMHAGASLLPGQWRQRVLRGYACLRQVGQDDGQGVLWPHLGVAVGADHAQGHLGGRAGQRREQVHAIGARPVQVVEH